MVQIEIPFDFLAVSVPLLGSCHHEAIASASLPGRRRLVYVYILVSNGAKVSQTSLQYIILHCAVHTLAMTRWHHVFPSKTYHYILYIYISWLYIWSFLPEHVMFPSLNRLLVLVKTIRVRHKALQRGERIHLHGPRLRLKMIQCTLHLGKSNKRYLFRSRSTFITLCKNKYCRFWV